ncbi:MAG: hypothetical protein ABIT38_18450, partial [Gemmatimonadaceae bacterium]
MYEGPKTGEAIGEESLSDLQRAWARELQLMRVARYAATVAGGIGTIVLVGWTFGIDAFLALLPGLIVMIPNTALGFVAASLSLWLLARERTAIAQAHALGDGSLVTGQGANPSENRTAHWVVIIAALFVLLLGVLTFIERTTDVDFGIDLLLFADRVRTYPYLPPGRMATNSTVGFTLAGAALLLASMRPRDSAPNGPGILTQALATAGLAIASIALVGYLYGARPLYAIDQAAGMALLTALAFAFLHAGILFLYPSRGGVGVMSAGDVTARLVRRLLASTILGCLTLGWLWIRGRELSLVGR